MRRFLDSADHVLARPFSGLNNWDRVVPIYQITLLFVLSAELDEGDTTRLLSVTGATEQRSVVQMVRPTI